MGFTDTLICAQAGVFFEVIVDPFGDPLTYTWSGPANVPINQNGSNIAEFDFGCYCADQNAVTVSGGTTPPKGPARSTSWARKEIAAAGRERT